MPPGQQGLLCDCSGGETTLRTGRVGRGSLYQAWTLNRSAYVSIFRCRCCEMKHKAHCHLYAATPLVQVGRHAVGVPLAESGSASQPQPQGRERIHLSRLRIKKGFMESAFYKFCSRCDKGYPDQSLRTNFGGDLFSCLCRITGPLLNTQSPKAAFL